MHDSKEDSIRLIYGMSEQTAERYIVVRKEIDLIVRQVKKAGYWLSEFEKVRPEGLCETLAQMGRSIVHSMAQIQDYIENEFVSLEKVYDTINKRKI